MITSLYRLVARLSRAVCRHPEGIVCEHRQYEYDLWTRGYLDGLAAGKRNMDSKWRGNVTGEGPYANYPPPAVPGLPSSFPVANMGDSADDTPRSDETPGTGRDGPRSQDVSVAPTAGALAGEEAQLATPGLPSSFPVGSVSGSPNLPHAYNVREEE